jgi:O-antigen ligase
MSIEGITHGVIGQRYGISGGSYGENFILDFTGRVEIYKIDLEIFSNHIYTGVGPGQANKLRPLYGYGRKVAAHTEYSRMLAEHGILGLLSLLLLIGVLIIHLSTPSPLKGKFIKILFGFLAILTMGHSAMRIAMPCITFGFLFLNHED